MQMRAQLMSSASSVAHLVGLGRAAKPAKTKPDDKKDDPQEEPGGEDEEARKAAAAEVAAAEAAAAQATMDAAVADAVKAALATQAAAKSDPDGDGDDDGDGSGDDDDKKEDDDEEMNGTGKKARARRRERARCRAILNSPHAAKNPSVAMHLALTTAMPRQQALALLEAMPKGAGGLDARMTQVPQPALGAGAIAQPGQDSAKVAGAWDAAFAKTARGNRPAANDTRAGWDRAMGSRK